MPRLMRRTARWLRVLLLTAAVPAMVSPASAAGKEDEAREAVYGIWATSGTMIEVKRLGERLSATIIALKNPNWREKDGVGRVGEPKTDLHNPDESLRIRPLIGLEMLEDYEFRQGRWRGKLYLPSNGTTWTSTARVKNGELHIRGFVGVPLLGKTQTFAPVASCNANILKMIEVAALSGTPCDGLLAAER